MKFTDLLLYIQKIQKECLPCRFNNSSTSTCDDISSSYSLSETTIDEIDEQNSSDLVIRSDITRIQTRLFDILTVRIINQNTNFTQMYYDHQEVETYLKGIHLNQLLQVSFPISNLEEFRDLEQKLIFGKLNSTVKVILPNKRSFATIAPPYSTIVVKAHFFDREKYIQFEQKISKTFKILDESKSTLK